MPEKEVHWDYDTPQILKYRSRMGIGVRRDEEGSPPAPLILRERVSTPKLKLHNTHRPRVLKDLESSSARDAFDGLRALSRKLDSRQKAKSSSSTDISPQFSEESLSKSESDLFSDDDSMLIRCTQEAEQRLESCCIQNENIENLKEEEEIDFDMGEDSFDVILSQMDEEEICARDTASRKTSNYGEIDSVQENCNMSSENPADQRASGLQSPARQRLNPTDPRSSSLHSPASDRSMKRFKSSDDGVPQKKSPSLRKIRSSPVIPLATLQPKVCTQAQIEQKKQAARRRRQLSQMKTCVD